MEEWIKETTYRPSSAHAKKMIKVSQQAIEKLTASIDTHRRLIVELMRGDLAHRVRLKGGRYFVQHLDGRVEYGEFAPGDPAVLAYELLNTIAGNDVIRTGVHLVCEEFVKFAVFGHQRDQERGYDGPQVDITPTLVFTNAHQTHQNWDATHRAFPRRQLRGPAVFIVAKEPRKRETFIEEMVRRYSPA